MTRRSSYRGNATEYGILLALVAALCIYGLKTLGPALSGNFNKVDTMGTLSLLAPLRVSAPAPVNRTEAEVPQHASPSAPASLPLPQETDTSSVPTTIGGQVTGSLGKKSKIPSDEEDGTEKSAPLPPRQPSPPHAAAYTQDPMSGSTPGASDNPEQPSSRPPAPLQHRSKVLKNPKRTQSVLY